MSDRKPTNANMLYMMCRNNRIDGKHIFILQYIQGCFGILSDKDYTNISKKIGSIEPNVRRRIKSLVKYNFLRVNKEIQPPIYELTEKSKQLLIDWYKRHKKVLTIGDERIDFKKIQRRPQKIIRAHDYLISCKPFTLDGRFMYPREFQKHIETIFRTKKEIMFKLKYANYEEVRMKNWKKPQRFFRDLENECTIIITTRHVLIRLDEVYGHSIEEIKSKAIYLINRISDKIEIFLRLRLSKPDRIAFSIRTSSQEYGMVESEVKKELNKEGYKKFRVVDENGELRLIFDESIVRDPTGRPINLNEFEAVHHQKSPEDTRLLQDLLLDAIEDRPNRWIINNTKHYVDPILKNSFERMESSLDKQTIANEKLTRQIVKHLEATKQWKKTAEKLPNAVKKGVKEAIGDFLKNRKGGETS